MKTYTIIYEIKLLNIKQAKVFSNSVSISLRYYITKFENFHSAMCMTPQSQNVRLSKATVRTFYTSNPKRISPDCPFKSNQRPTAKFILT